MSLLRHQAEWQAKQSQDKSGTGFAISSLLMAN